jgi:FdhD protein
MHPFPPRTQAHRVHGTKAGLPFESTDWLADEVAVALEYNGVAHAVMLATPHDLEDFALGFSLTEGVLHSRHDLFSIEVHHSPHGITLAMHIASSCFAQLKNQRRSLAGRTGCGLCGVERLAQLHLPCHTNARAAAQKKNCAASQVFSTCAITRAIAQLPAHQTLQQLTGAVHAAAWCTADGQVQLLREDIGRHNALDKLIGALATKEFDAPSGFIAITSRASFEMVQKAAYAQVPLLAAVSAPTALAVRTAQTHGLSLLGFVRGEDMVVYC